MILANTLYTSSPDHGTGITVLSGAAVLGDIASDFDGGRDDVIRYDSPSIYGFIVSASWGDDDYWDVALRFAKEWNSVRIAAAIAYQDISPDEFGGDADATVVSGSVSLMHIPTGLFASFSAGEKEIDFDDRDASYWYVQAGIEQSLVPYGKTTFYGEYGNYDDVLTLVPDANALSSNAERWGVGVVQHFDSAAMDIYAQATFWDLEADFANEDSDSSDLTTVMVGSRIQF